jgi:hypothetical protein
MGGGHDFILPSEVQTGSSSKYQRHGTCDSGRRSGKETILK